MIFSRPRYIVFSPVLIYVLALISCNEDTSSKKILSGKTGVEEAKKVTIQYSLGGKRKAFLSGPVMYRVHDTASYIEFPKTLHVDFYNDSEKIDSKLDALYARYKENQDVVFLRDSVRVINTKGDTLYCNELYWDKSRYGSEFYTDKPVRIRTKTHIINGIGMDARQDFKEWHIVQSTGFVKIPASQFPQ